MTQNDKGSERGNFVQYPCQLIYNCSNLNRDDRWALLSIMGVCWTEEFYKLSYRDVSKLSGIPLSMLSSITGKDGRPDKEGIMDRLKRLEYIYCALGKELNSATGKPRGNAQTYIKVNYTKIWAESILYKITPYSPQKDFEPVSYTNRLTEKPDQPVSYTNAPVLHANTSVPNTNRPVSYTNAPVHDLSVNRPPYITYTNIDNLDKTDKDTFVASATPPSDFSNLYESFGDTPHQGNDQNATPFSPDLGGVGSTNTLPKGSASPTLAGRNTAALEANHHADADNMVPDHNAIPEPTVSPTMPLTESQGVNVPPTPTKPSENALRTQETLSSVPAHDESSNQATGDDPIATGATKKVKAEVPVGSPVMPGDDVAWNAETIVQIHEAHQGRRYPNGAKRKSDRIRDKELGSAQSLLAMSSDLWTPNASENRQHLLDIIIRLETRHNNWWIDTNGHVMPHQLVDKDRIHMINDEIKRQRPSNVTPMPQRQQSPSNGTSSFRAPTGMVDKDEMNKLMDMDPEQRREYMRAKKQARLEQEQQQRAVL